MPEPILGHDLWKMADRNCSYGKPPDDDDEPERTMPVGPFLDSLGHSDDCNCEWCRNGDRGNAIRELELGEEIERLQGLLPGKDGD